MKLRCAHGSLEFRRAYDLTEECVCLKKDIIFEENIVNPDYAFLTQQAVVQVVQAAAHLKTYAEMGVVIEIGAGRNDPIDEPGAHERYDGCHSDSRWRHCA